VLAISSCLVRKDRSIARGRLHEMLDQEGAAGCVTAWSKTAPGADEAYLMIDKALAGFASQRPRPVHISVPIDVLGAAADAAPAPCDLPRLPIADTEDVERIADLLAGAERPLFVLGGGAKHASTALRSLVRKSGAVVFPTYAGKGIIPDSVGPSLGSYLGRPGSIEVIAKSDLVLVFGSELSETDLWRDRLGETAPMVRIDIDPDVLMDDHRAEIQVLGDVGAFAADLDQALGKSRRDCWLNTSELNGVRAGFRAATDAERPGIVPVLEAMAAVLPEEITIVSDMTQFAYVGKEVVPMSEPGRWHHPTGFGTLGYALPAAIGAKIGLKDGPVIALIGDYGFHYTMQELGVAVELGLSLPIILWDNGKLKEIEDSMVASQIEPNAVVAQNPDFPKLAEAFGAATATPDKLGKLQDEIKAAFARKGPTLIYVTPDILG